jgi:hypothetical protein
VKLIQKKQSKILKICSELIKQNKKDYSQFCYFAFWVDSVGYYKIAFKINWVKNFFKFFYRIFKEVYFSTISIKYEIIKNPKIQISDYKKIIFLDASLADFDDNGNFLDRYFRTTPQKNKDYLYYVIYRSNKLPKKISKNLILLKYEYLFFEKYYFLRNFFLILKKLIMHQFNLVKFIDENSLTTKLSKIIELNLKKDINFKNIKKLLISFEAQPHQLNILNIFKLKNNKIKTIAYDHSTPHALPIHMFYRFKSLDYLIVNGENQKKFLTSQLKWPSKKIKIKKSLRYQLVDNFNYSSKVFLPFNIFNKEKILKEFKIILRERPNLARNLIVRNHPLKEGSKKHINLLNSLKLVIEDHANKLIKRGRKNYVSIFIGHTTSVIVALEKNIDVIHICENPIVDMYNSKMWKNLITNQISDSSFEYKLLKKNSFLNFTKNSKNKIIRSYE